MLVTDWLNKNRKKKEKERKEKFTKLFTLSFSVIKLAIKWFWEVVI